MRRRGFTLLEMLVVLSIIALLLSLAAPRYFGALDRSREVVMHENLRILRTCIDQFHADRGRFPASLGELVTLRYLRVLPTDPITESTSTWKVRVGDDGEGIVDVHSGAQGTDRQGVAWASY